MCSFGARQCNTDFRQHYLVMCDVLEELLLQGLDKSKSLMKEKFEETHPMT